MTPTPEQIAQWAREAGWPSFTIDNLPGTEDMRRMQRFATLVDAHRAEQDAKLCETEWSTPQEKVYGQDIAEYIRASVKGKECQN